MMESRSHRERLTIIARDLAPALVHAATMRGAFDVTVVQTATPLAAARGAGGDALIVGLAADAPVVELRALLVAHRFGAIVFVADELPLRHAIARIIADSRQVAVAATEHPLVVQATLVALMRRASVVA